MRSSAGRATTSSARAAACSSIVVGTRFAPTRAAEAGRAAAARLRADTVFVSDPLKRLEEGDEVDHAFARHQPLIVAHLFSRLASRVGHVHVDDVRLARCQNIRRGGAGVMPVPGIQSETDIGTALFGECERLVHPPDEFVGLARTEMQGPQEFDAKTDL